MSSPSLLIIGSVAIDNIRTPKGAATDQLGGSATFAALAAKHWSSPLILSAIGADFPAALLQRLQNAGLDLSRLTRDAGKSFRWEGVYNEDLGTRETIGIDLGVMESAKLMVPDLSTIRFAMMATYAPARELEAIERLPKDTFIATDTIAVYINIPELRKSLDALVKRSALVCFDETELKDFAQTKDEAQAVKAIFAKGPRFVIAKYGKRGSRLYSHDGQTAAWGIFDNVPKDTTGAGDTFLGTIMAHLAAVGKADFKTILEGMKLGTAAASITTEAFGVEDLIKSTKAEIERRASGVSAS